MNNEFVLIASVVMYFLLACSVGALVVLPGLRQRCVNGFTETISRLYTGWRGFSRTTVGRHHRLAGHLHNGFHDFRSALWERRRHLAVVLLMLLIPVFIVLLLKPNIRLQGYEDGVSDGNELVASLLQGEQLAPPPPLPPEAFLSHDVELVRPLLISASRDWLVLDTDFQQRLLLVFKLMEERHGYKVVLLEGYRSPERQDFLAGLGKQVTNAGAYQSYHQYGLAADCAFLRDGKVVISERDPWAMKGYQLYGELAESIGLVWGGRWKMMDFGHVELRKPGVRKQRLPSAAG